MASTSGRLSISNYYDLRLDFDGARALGNRKRDSIEMGTTVTQRI